MTQDIIVPSNGREFRIFAEEAAAKHPQILSTLLRNGIYKMTGEAASAQGYEFAVLDLTRREVLMSDHVGSEGALWVKPEGGPLLYFVVERHKPVVELFISRLFDLEEDQLPSALPDDYEHGLYLQYLYDIRHDVVDRLGDTFEKIGGTWRGLCNFDAGLRRFAPLATKAEVSKAVAEAMSEEGRQRAIRRAEANAVWPAVHFGCEGEDCPAIAAIDAGERLMPVLNNHYGIHVSAMKALQKKPEFLKERTVRLRQLKGLYGDMLHEDSEDIMRSAAYAGYNLAIFGAPKRRFSQKDAMFMHGEVDFAMERMAVKRIKPDVLDLCDLMLAKGGYKVMEANLDRRKAEVQERMRLNEEAFASMRELGTFYEEWEGERFVDLFADRGIEVTLLRTAEDYIKLSRNRSWHLFRDGIIFAARKEGCGKAHLMTISKDLTTNVEGTITAGIQPGYSTAHLEEWLGEILSDPEVEAEFAEFYGRGSTQKSHARLIHTLNVWQNKVRAVGWSYASDFIFWGVESDEEFYASFAEQSA